MAKITIPSIYRFADIEEQISFEDNLIVTDYELEHGLSNDFQSVWRKDCKLVITMVDYSD